uniref:Cuticle protein n=1 Tax=Glossina brevipalpis TaxID=37001 RepID=A0A1A9W4I1_9MUSC
MELKLAVIFTLLVGTNAGLIPSGHIYHNPVSVATHPVLSKTSDEYDSHPQYKYSYDVQDSVSGDSKSQVEERDGDVVRGEYSLVDSDGFKRTVQYTADSINGFNAVVNREPLGKIAASPGLLNAVVPAISPAAIVKTVAPVTHYSSAPVYRTAPAVYHTAPSTTVVKTLTPNTHYTTQGVHYAAPALYKTLTPVSHVSAPVVAPAYTTYTAPATYLAHH